ncbi:hypothetical protein CCACVL1_02288 [Corchorus capsularis]|uniref:Uncharacterized protein n=1 Tax=Corchorus capsularis TaxID=210143 RepID=A0A1R3K9D8_COCAP|nr:hypothetical protein CCACVL1_02288 [Corchorus capsularis]
MANNSTRIVTTANQNSKPNFVKKRSTRSSKHKPKTVVLKLKYRENFLCNVSTRSDELPTSKSPIKTQPQLQPSIVNRLEPKKMNDIVVPVVEKKQVPKKKKKRYITLLGRKEIEQDISEIAESLGRKRARRSKKKQPKEIKRTLALLFPGSQYLKSID